MRNLALVLLIVSACGKTGPAPTPSEAESDPVGVNDPPAPIYFPPDAKALADANATNLGPKYTVSGTVTIVTGDCMPPAKCNPRRAPGRVKLVVRRGMTEDVAAVESGSDGRYRLSLPSGTYTFLDEGYPHGTVTVVDRPVTKDLVLDHTTH